MQETNSDSIDKRRTCDAVSGGGNVVSITRKGAEVVIHINNLLGDPECAYVEEQLRTLTGITATHDAGQLASIEILDQLRAQGLTAQLIGPI